MKNWNARGSRSWASRVMGLLTLVALVVVMGAAPTSARIRIDDGGDDGGGGEDSGGDDGGTGSCLDNVHGELAALPDSLIAWGQSTTLWWSANPGTCAKLKLVTSSRREWSLSSSTGQATKAPIFSPDGTEGYTLVAYNPLGSRPLAHVTVQVQLPPTVTITADNQGEVGVFLHAIATPWQRIEIQNDVNLDLSGEDYLYIAPGVQIIGGRSPTNPGPRLFTTTFPKRLFNIGSPVQLEDKNANGILDENASDNVRISGIRLQGPEMGIAAEEDADDWPATGIVVWSSVNVEIDNNELFGWASAAVSVGDPFNRINRDNYNTVWVHDNFIHHNQRYGTLGYGVVVGRSAYALIEKNVFDYNRHAISASGGDFPTGYYALSNLVLWGGGLNNGTWNLNTHQFDVHGSYSCCGPGGWEPEAYCGDAGEHFEFRYNTILYDHGAAIKVRGEPSQGAIADHNVFQHPDEWGGCLNDAALVQNEPGVNLGSLNNTFGADFDDMLVPAAPGRDFNGDGAPDDFLATGATWWYRSGALGADSPWRHLNTSTKRRSQLTLGDVSGDGVCDVTDDNGVVYLGGVTKVPPPPSPLPTVPDVRGNTLSEASSALTAAGFAKGTVSYVTDSLCNNIGLVTSQSPAAGTHAEAGTLVNLSVGKEPSTLCP